MKKRLGLFVGMLVILLALGATTALAFPSGTWVSGVTVANLSSDTASVVLTFYNPDGSVAFEVTGESIDGNAAKTWYLPNVTGLSDGFIGSAVVSSDQPVAAIVNTQLPSGSNPARVGTSLGVSNPSTKMYATQVMKEYYGWNSYCVVQNTGSATAIITGTYYNAAGTAVYSESVSVAPYASHIFDQQTEANLPSSFSGSAVFEGEQPIAAVCNFYNSGGSAATSQIHSYNGLSEGGSTLYVPRIVKDYYDYQSGLKIQNVGTEVLSVTVTYNIGGNTYQQVSPDIAPGQAWGPYMGDESQLPASMAGVQGSGSAVIEVNSPNANKLIIATVNEDNRVNPAGRGATYAAALPTDATTTLVFPQITSEYYGYSSGMQVMKIGSGDVACTASFAASGNVAAFSQDFTLTDSAPSWSLFAPNAQGMVAGIANDNYNGAVTISCDGNVVGIANLSYRYDYDNRYGNVLGDSFTTARGINK